MSGSNSWRRAALMAVMAVVFAGAVMTDTGWGAESRSSGSGRSGCRFVRMKGSATPLPFGSVPCPGVRPGGILITEEGGLCSYNFLFRGSDRRRYIGTAGHCAVGPDEEKTWRLGRGPKVLDVDGKEVGEFAYATQAGPMDFALVRVAKGIETSAEMCYFGGPTGINDDITSETVILHHFGNGNVLGYESATGTYTLPARTEIAFGLQDPDEAFAYGAAIFGDSGSGVISDDGRAVGVLVTGGVNADDSGAHGIIGITRITPQIEAAEKELRVRLRLMKAELQP
ncbi:MAG: trypsin-like serine protease [Actinomycetota bacterium]